MPSRDFAPERANRSLNLFDAIVAHLDELVAAGERPLIAAYSEGTAERLRQVLADHGFDRLTRVERWAEVPEVGGGRHRRPAARARLQGTRPST